MLSFSDYKNAEAAIILLLKEMKIDIPSEKIVTELEKHPDYPSMLSLSDVLDNFNIENSAFRIDSDSIGEVSTPFIGHFKLDGGSFLVVHDINKDYVRVSGNQWRNKRFSVERFNSLFNGVGLIIEAPETKISNESIFSFFKSIKSPAMIVGACLIIAAFLIFHTGYIDSPRWPVIILTVFKVMGVIVSVLLLSQYINKNNPLVKKLCQGEGRGKLNCNAILSSKAAVVFEGLSWSEVGFFYFTGTLFTLIIGGQNNSLLYMLAIINFISLPYTFYSIYFQAFVARQWCVFCCMVQALLWLEFAVFATIFKTPLVWPEYADWGNLIIGMLTPVLAWLLLKPLLLNMQQLKSLKDQLRLVKYNSRFFKIALHDQPRYTLPDEAWSIVLGNPDATNVIVMVSNPYCGPCAATHVMLDELLENNAELQARIIFSTDNAEFDKRTSVGRHLMALNALDDKSLVKNALDSWYKQSLKNYEKWAKLYPVDIHTEEIDKLDMQRAWCRIADIAGTPAVLLNGYHLPDFYRLSDIKYMIT